MAAGEVPADWRQERVAVRALIRPSEAVPGVRFLDVESLQTRRELRTELAPLLAYYEIGDLDVATVRGGDRRITRWISKWAFDQRDANGKAVYAGIRYLSRLSSEWECWAVFQDVGIAERERRDITRENPSLRRVATDFGLTVY